MKIEAFFDPDTFTLTYVVFDPATKDAVIIDPVLDFEPQGGILSRESLTRLTGFITSEKLTVRYILETHAHADHLTGAQDLKLTYPGAVLAIGARITEVQNYFRNLFNLGPEIKTDGSQFDRLLQNGDVVNAGSLTFKVIHTPGHTPACVSYLFEDALFVGDAIFMPDYGTGRCDFPMGSADDLYRSITTKIYSLPPETRIFTCHDYLPNGRDLRFMATVEEQMRSNIQLKEDTGRDDFIRFRNARDKTLKAPKLLLPSIQVNIDAGRLPLPENNGTRYLKLPLSESK